MSNILNDLGLEENDFKWFDMAICRGMDTNLFYDKYESDPIIASSIDEACLSCPVSKDCFESGTMNNDHGVWGGVYLNSGEIDKIKNIHKTKEFWQKIKTKNGI